MTAYANKAQLLAHFFTHKKVSFFFVVNIECVFFFLVVSVYEFVYVHLCVCKLVMRCKISLSFPSYGICLIYM